MPQTNRAGASAAVLGAAAFMLTAAVPPAWSQGHSSISANPGAVDEVVGTGRLGRELGFGPQSGVRLGGVWLGDTNYLLAGGVDPESWGFNSLLVIDLSLDLERLLRVQGAQLSIEFLQYNGQPVNADAGAVTGYNSLPGPLPLDRSELYKLWWRQELFDEKLIVRVGKSVPTVDFGNVVRPLSLDDESLAIPVVSSLIYKPIFVNATMLDAMPGFYNSAYGVAATVAPTKNFYLSAGVYDGNLARGVQTGIEMLPEFNGYYFTIGEIGTAWRLGQQGKPGTAAVGAWKQTGELTPLRVDDPTLTEDGASGIYTFGSQRVWLRDPGIDNSGVSVFFQFGVNDSDTLPVNTYYGAGFTGFGLVRGRPHDSLGAGIAVSKLNQKLGFRDEEVLLAVYYQFQLKGDFSLQPTLTYIPDPGERPNLAPATALTVRLTSLF